MIMIDDQWENVDTLEDIYKIIQNKLGDEIVYKLNEIIEIMIEESHSKRIDELEQELYYAESENGDLEDEIYNLKNEINRMREIICDCN